MSSGQIYRETRFDVFDTKRSLMQLKNIICTAHSEIDAEYLAKLFKLKVGTVRAWRAHYARGTYQFSEPPAMRIVATKGVGGKRVGWGRATMAAGSLEDMVVPETSSCPFVKKENGVKKNDKLTS